MFEVLIPDEPVLFAAIRRSVACKYIQDPKATLRAFGGKKQN
jgi:hypothetical protein